MPTNPPPPPMHPVKLWLYLFLLAVAIVLAIVTSYRGLTDQTITSIIISVMTTLLVIPFVELIPELIRKATEQSEAARFIRFFGNAAMTEPVRLVFARRAIRSNVGDPWVTHYHVPDSNGETPVPEGVNAWIPAQDIRAAVPLANLFLQYAHKNVEFTYDDRTNDDDFNYCAISIGLGFNGFTHRLAGWCDDSLFKIEFGPSIKKSFTKQTDFFVLGDGRIPIPPDGQDDALIARIVNSAETKKQICFVCAGRSAQGTAAAGDYLAKHWENIMHIYETNKLNLDKTSLAVVIRHKVDQSGNLEFSKADLAKGADGSTIWCSK